MDNSTGSLKDYQQTNRNPWRGYITQAYRNLTIAAQDQSLNTRYYQKNIKKQPTDSKCRMCCKAEEHPKHNVAACTTRAPSEYTN